MKKICFLFAALMTVATVLLLGACASVDPDISERRSDYFTAADGTFEITAVSGVRETPYETDGTAEKLISYTLITVAPTDRTAFDVDAVYEYEAELPNCDRDKTGKDAGRVFGGALIVHPFAASYSAEFAYEAKGSFKVAVICKENGEAKRHEYTLTSLVTEDMMSYDSAVHAAKNEFDIDAEHETRVRLIKSPVGDGLCWYVAFYFKDGGSCGVLLDPTTAKVLAKKSD